MSEHATHSHSHSHCCGHWSKTLAAWLIRIAAAAVLLLSGLDKFKSSSPPYSFAMENYYGKESDKQEGKAPKWSKIVNVIFQNSGLDNADQLGGGFANFNSHAFALFGRSLPWMFFVSGLLVALGLFQNIGYFLGGLTFVSLFIGQCLLPEASYMMYLITFALLNVGGLLLSKFDWLTLDQLFKSESEA